ncbi:MAG: hypothetical protein B7C24_15755, partial [Bacteroidetes bacterium 4572_77]
MNTSISLLEGVSIMMAIILIVVGLKKWQILHKDDSLLFSKIVLNLTLPAVIFSSLAVKSFDIRFLQMSGIMALIEILMMFIAWSLASLLRFDNGKKGALILVASFGMTSLLGYPIIRQVFPGNAMAMEEAVVTSEFGVGLLLFIFAPIIAMYYGESKVEARSVFLSVRKFFVSPVFVALVLGLVVSFFPQVKNVELLSTVLRLFKLIGGANLLMVALTIGLILEFSQFGKVAAFLAVALSLKLLVKPFLSVW